MPILFDIPNSSVYINFSPILDFLGYIQILDIKLIHHIAMVDVMHYLDIVPFPFWQVHLFMGSMDGVPFPFGGINLFRGSMDGVPFPVPFGGINLFRGSMDGVPFCQMR